MLRSIERTIWWRTQRLTMSASTSIGSPSKRLKSSHSNTTVSAPAENQATKTTFRRLPSALSLKIVGRFNRARASVLTLPHGDVRTPVFMPVGTQASIKGLTSEQMASEPINCAILLNNTYHLALRPGTHLIDEFGGTHKFMNWPRNVLTDSGGFQMVSLSKLCEITEEGVTFESFVDGTKMLLTPEMSIQHQNRIGSDIMMQLDDVVSSVTQDDDRFKEACERSIRWLDRCMEAHANPETQNLFGIIQGGLDVSPGGLRDFCLEQMIARDLPGYAIGGLAGGESKEAFWPVVAKCAKALPEHKPRYLMGVGYPLDLVICSALGVDMFDCVYPTRTARFGTAIVESGLLKLKLAKFENDLNPIDKDCKCQVCQQYTRAQLRVLLKKDNSVGPQLITVHNVTWMLNFMLKLRQSIIDGTFETFVRDFMKKQFPDEKYPQWTIDALQEAGIQLV